MVAKNTLLRKALEGTAFEPLSECSTGMNAWVFVDENVAPTKIDLITKIAVGIKQVPTKLARGTKGNANKLGYAAKAIAEGKSDLIQA